MMQEVPIYPNYVINEYELRSTDKPPSYSFSINTNIRVFNKKDKKYYFWRVYKSYTFDQPIDRQHRDEIMKMFIAECYMVIVLGDTSQATKLQDTRGIPLLIRDPDQISERDRLNELRKL